MQLSGDRCFPTIPTKTKLHKYAQKNTANSLDLIDMNSIFNLLDNYSD